MTNNHSIAARVLAGTLALGVQLAAAQGPAPGQQDVSPDLHRRHLERLAVPLGVGYGLALVPMFIRVPISFVAFLVLTLLAMILFRQAVLGLRGDNKRRGNI